MDDTDHRALFVRAACAADHARSLALREPAWGSQVRRIAGGWLVLAGPGMYVNQAMAAGVDGELTAGDLDILRSCSMDLGVDPAVEVTPSTLPASLRRIRDAGFGHDSTSDITLLTTSVSTATIDAPDDVLVRSVESDEDLRLWQETSASGWGHTSDDARLPSDAFAAAAHALDNEHMVIAFDRGDGRPVGCASMTVRAGVAVLGGMSTLPAERRRGVQATLIRYRLTRAQRVGCDLAMTTAASGSASARNLRRHGFEPRLTIRRFTLPAASEAAK